MPLGGAHRGIWRGQGGLSTADDFNRANGALGSTNSGNILSWQAVKGTWSISSNRPTTADARDTNPVTVVDAASPDVDVSVAVSSGGGDALYFRVKDANNWLRMRVANTTYSSTYSYTCAYTYSYTCYSSSAKTCYATSYCAQYSSYCYVNYASPSNSGCGCAEASCTYKHQHAAYTCYSTSASACCPSGLSHAHYGSGSCYCTDCNTHNHVVNNTYNGSTGSTVACGTYSYTCYSQVSNTCYATAYKTCYATAYAAEPSTVLDKNVAGTVTTLVEWADNPTTLRAVTSGTSVTPMINGSAKPPQTVTDHQSATKHGFGRGPSTNNGTALDNFALTAQ